MQTRSTCIDFQSETFPSPNPLNDDRSCFVCLDASCQILAYSTIMQIQTAENSGVTMPAMYHGGRISSNSHALAVGQLFQNIGTMPMVTPSTHPILITINATRRVMYLCKQQLFWWKFWRYFLRNFNFIARNQLFTLHSATDKQLQCIGRQRLQSNSIWKRCRQWWWQRSALDTMCESCPVLFRSYRMPGDTATSYRPVCPKWPMTKWTSSKWCYEYVDSDWWRVLSVCCRQKLTASTTNQWLPKAKSSHWFHQSARWMLVCKAGLTLFR